MSELKSLIHTRGQIKASLTRFVNYLDGDRIDKYQVQIRMNQVKSSFDEFERIQLKIESLSEEGKEAELEQERVTFENSYFSALAKAQSYLDEVNTNVSVTNIPPSPIMTNTDQTYTHVKLPPIKLPTFGGKYEEWLPFRDIFEAIIDKDESLKDIQRMYYLKTALTGEAAEVVRSLELTSNNYSVCWKLLKDRYENVNIISQNHVKALFDAVKLEKESAVGLRQLLDHTLKHLRSLSALGYETDKWDLLIIHLITSKFDQVTFKEWQTQLNSLDSPTFNDLEQFMTARCQVLEAVASNKSVSNKSGSSNHGVLSSNYNNQHKQNYNKQKPFMYKSCYASNTVHFCKLCEQSHQIFECDQFLSSSVDKRIKLAMKHRYCLNCLKSGHKSSDCYSTNKCQKCNKSHNTLLHLEKSSKDDQNIKSDQSSKTDKDVNVTAHSSIKNSSNQVLLSTALIDLEDTFGNKITCRALLDCGSQSNFLTDNICKKLKLKRYHSTMSVSGINQNNSSVCFTVKAKIKSKVNSFQRMLEFLVLDKITNKLPNIPFTWDNWNIPQGMKLADPYFNTCGEIDVLLGADIFWNLLCVGQYKPNNNQPILQKTTLGWIVGGTIASEKSKITINCHLSTVDNLLQENIAKFWEIENCEMELKYCEEEQWCENHYTTNTVFEDGRFTVKLPIKPNNLNCLNGSKNSAVKRFISLERKLNIDPALKEQYIAFMNEYQRLNHMEIIPAEEIEINRPTYYIPHHPVFKQDSITTKLRVVFDASCKTTSEASLNEVLMNGPVVQDQLCSIVMRFREHRFVMCADIEKMYRQIRIDRSQIDLQRIVWRTDSNQPLTEYRLLTVTYGTKSAPYLATRTLAEIANRAKDEFPEASEIIRKDFYVDDLITGTDNINDAMRLQNEIMSILMKSGFHLRKWCSNEQQIISNLESNQHDEHMIHKIDSDSSIKTLGLIWHPFTDTFSFQINNIKNKQDKITKRSILSEVASIFDPLGIVGPVIVVAKVLLQELWQLKINWDESVPLHIHTKWSKYKNTLPYLQHIKIHRRITHLEHIETTELHCFSDASVSAYGAAIYVRCINKVGEVSVNLLCAKSKVAPLKVISLPRLELCAALVLAKLYSYVKNSLRIKFDKTVFWTDSTIVLCWLSSPSNHWTTFVANRVAKIQDITQITNWHHVKSKENPADLISRGLTADQLINNHLWWHGPQWLHTNEFLIEDTDIKFDVEEIPDRKKNINVHSCVKTFNIINKYSNLNKLIRVIAYCLRIFNNFKSKRKSQPINLGTLSVLELNNALNTLIKIAQMESFSVEIKALKAGNNVNNDSKLLNLHPFIDSKGIIRVGGRLAKSDILYDRKFPIVLPSNHHLSDLIAANEHIITLHAGQQALLASLRLKYWPLRGRNLVRKIIGRCKACVTANPKGFEQLMGDLPKERVVPVRPFLNVGLDYAGPFYISQGRKKSPTKGYVAVFVCLATKAIHLELVTDLTTKSFLAAFKRFISRRGKCGKIFCDNARTFVGAKRELKELFELVNSNEHNEEVSAYLAKDNIEWKWIPPRSPHMGGIWEAAVKSLKYHIRRVIGNAYLSWEEFSTFLCQVEACLNSRPLSPLSTDPNDLTFLTPSHFLIGDVLIATVEPNLQDIKISRLDRWQRMQQLFQHFWTRWSNEYLVSLQQRSRWKKENSNISIGTMVLIREDNIPPLKWVLARVENVHPGEDGKVRVISVRTSSGITKRAITKICPLPFCEEDDKQEMKKEEDGFNQNRRKK